MLSPPQPPPPGTHQPSEPDAGAQSPGIAARDFSGHTPVMQQYLSIKAEHPGVLVFYRMGDFYELFYEDAERAARLLNLTLTARGMSGGAPVRMAGVPAVSVDQYLARLVRRANPWPYANKSAIRRPRAGLSSGAWCASSRRAP